jgi:hypothetical protein
MSIPTCPRGRSISGTKSQNEVGIDLWMVFVDSYLVHTLYDQGGHPFYYAGLKATCV